MNTLQQRIEDTYNEVYDSIATINATLSYDEVLEKIIILCEDISEVQDSEFIWILGEFNAFTLDTLLVQSYWFLTEYHKGLHSLEYRAMCAIGAIFNPGMTDLSCEEDLTCYNLLKELSK